MKCFILVYVPSVERRLVYLQLVYGVLSATTVKYCTAFSVKYAGEYACVLGQSTTEDIQENVTKNPGMA